MKRLLIVLLVLLGSSTSFASVLHYRIKRGDTLDTIARQYYGSDKKDLYIIMLNRLDPSRPLKPGRIILIPFVTVLTVRKHETFRILAGRYLKDPRKAGALALLNGREAGSSLRPGTTVRIPFELFYQVRPGDTLDALAETYLGDKKDAVFLRDYNRLKTLNSIRTGMVIAIPIMPERVRPVNGKKRTPQEPGKAEPVLYRKDLLAGIALYGRGDYTHSVEKLMDITIKVPRDRILKKDLVTIHLYRACDYIALGENVAARGEFMELLKLDKNYRMNPRFMSPSIRAVFDDVKRQQHPD